jgi:hypothetical protein
MNNIGKYKEEKYLVKTNIYYSNILLVLKNIIIELD